MKEKNAYFTLCLLWVMAILNSSPLQTADLPTEFKYLLLPWKNHISASSPAVLPPPFLSNTQVLSERKQGYL